MKTLFEELESLMNHYKNYRPTVGTNTRVILERRYQAFKFIKLGVHSKAENEQALELCERLMDISNSKHANEKDEWLLSRLVDIIQTFETATYG